MSAAALLTGVSIAALAVAILSPAEAPAQEQQTPAAAAAPRVVEVRFDGAVFSSESFLLGQVAVRADQALDRESLDADVRRLLRTGRFLDVSVAVADAEGGVAVTFTLTERPVVTDIRFAGNVKFDDKDLRNRIGVSVGDIVDLFLVRQGRDAIVEAYRDQGYGEVLVSIDEAQLRESGTLLYTIEEGPHIRIRKIRFEGNALYEERSLSPLTRTRAYWWPFRDGLFDVEQVESDAAAIQSFYREQGYLDARASYRLEFSPDRQDLQVVYTIAEGTRYHVESVIARGHSVYNDEEILAAFGLTPGEVFLQRRMDRGTAAVKALYTDHGYIQAEVHTVRAFSETPGLVQITIDIEEGAPFTVGRIVVRGNRHTKDKVVRRAFRLYPEDLFNLSELRAAEQRLRETQIFNRASITPAGDQPDVRDVVVDVEESERAGDFVFGLGVNSDSGLLGSVVLDLKNFDLFDVPRSFGEFIKLRSFRGAGQRLRIELQPGTELNRFRIDFVEPYFLDKPINLGASVYFFERGREGYDEERVGANVSFGKRFSSGRLEGWSGEVALRIEQVRVSDVDFFSPSDARDDEGSDLLTSIKGTLVRDRTDNRFIPSSGDRLRLSYEQFGVLGGEFFGKFTGSYNWYRTLAVDEQERKSVLGLRARGGFILGDAPIYERFYAGGIGSLRGFDFRGVGPRQGLDEDPVGGDFLLLTGAEYSFPLYGQSLRGVLFTDMGTVEEEFSVSDWRVSAGFGVRLLIEALGPVPLEFDFAFPVASESDDDEQVFSFFVGAAL